MKSTRLSQLYVIVIVFPYVFCFLSKNDQVRNIENVFRIATRCARIETPRGKHVQCEESDSRGWWFRTELDRSITGSKLRLSPLSEGYKECCTGEGTRMVVEVVLAITAVEMSSCAFANLSLLHLRNFKSTYISSLPRENYHLSEHDLMLLI